MGVIVWSPRATADFERIVEYLLLEWNETVAYDFAEDVDRVLHIVSLMPEVYPKLNARKIRKAVVVKQVSLFYRIDEHNEDIRVLRLWDNRQNPTGLKY